MSNPFPVHPIVAGLLLMPALVGCNPDTFRDYVKPEELSDLRKEPKTTRFRQVGGVDLWSEGMPERKYRILGVIHDVRRNLGWRLSTYDQDIASAIRRAGGDGGIILMAESKVVERMATNCASFAPNDQECGDASGASQRLGSPSEEVTVYSENRESTSVPLDYKDSHILVIKYLD